MGNGRKALENPGKKRPRWSWQLKSSLRASLAPSSRIERANALNDGAEGQSVGKPREQAQLPSLENLHPFRTTLRSHDAEEFRLR